MTTNKTNYVQSRPMKAPLHHLWRAMSVAVLAMLGIETASAQFNYRDTLEKVVNPMPTDIPDLSNGNLWDLFVTDQESYDNNLYRLPAGVTDLAALGIAGGSREDHINTQSAGFDGSYAFGRQIFLVDVRVDDNRYAQNTDLNYVSSTDRAVWDWQILSTLSGQIGADYSRSLAGFVNTTVYTRNVVDTADYFAGGRWALGPRWTVFGGVVETDTKLSAAASRLNDTSRQSGAVGAEFATNAVNTIGAEYRFTKTTYPDVGNSDSNYNEDRARAYVKYLFSEKTEIDATAGYLWREYPSRAFGNFSGDVWRISGQWQMTEKTQLIALGWRELQAYLTQESNYYVSNGFSISPTWNPTDSINTNLLVSTEKQDYIGSSLDVAGELRHDRVNAAQAAINYTPNYTLWRDFTLSLSVRHEQRTSDYHQFTYNDTIANAGLTFKFSRR
jgi:hypothetical protein